MRGVESRIYLLASKIYVYEKNTDAQDCEIVYLRSVLHHTLNVQTLYQAPHVFAPYCRIAPERDTLAAHRVARFL